MRQGLCALLLAFVASVGYAGTTFDQMVGDTTVNPVEESGVIQLPYIFWGGDLPVLLANGGNTTTQKGSMFDKAGLKFRMVPGDDFPKQVKAYLSGQSPYLRATMGMAGLASEVCNKDPRTKPVALFQLTWSLGDHMVARPTVKSLNDLKGKKVALQQAGPHVTLVEDSLQAAGLTWQDITPVWCKNLSGKDSPPEMFRNDPSIDACCCISPDMIGLCGGLDKRGGTAEGNVKDCRVVNSTSTMSHSIVDLYFCRSDYFAKHREEVQKFVAAYFDANEDLLKWKKAYDDGKGKSPEYVAALKLAQSTWGIEALPTIEVDTHGLVCDVKFVQIVGNESFFTDPNNLVGFEAKQKQALELAVKLGLTKEKFGFSKADWDYKALATAAGQKYVPPVRETGRIRTEVVDFSKDLDDNTIVSFTVLFEPEQSTFSVETYGADFQRGLQAISTFGNAVLLIRGHSDPTMALQNFFWAAKAKGMLTGQPGAYYFKGQPLTLADTKSVMKAIQEESLAGQYRQNKQGQTVPVDDPRGTVSAALTLSQTRANAVKVAMQEFAKNRNVSVDLSQIQPQGVGIAEPVVPKPASLAEAKKNMRVEFRVVRVSAEAVSDKDFKFEE